MTNQEAREIIRNIDKAFRAFTKTEIQALEMAIKALEQEPCDDAISRQKVLDLLEDTDNGWIINEVLQLPSVKPQESKWIPVSEGLPEDHENVLIYLSSNQITIGLYNSHRLPFMDKPIGWGADAPHGWSSDEVVAWMPLPEPYKSESEEV